MKRVVGTFVMLIAVALSVPGAAGAARTLVWGKPLSVDQPPGEFVGITCRAPSLCIAYDDTGKLFASANAFARKPRWKGARVARTALEAVSCPSRRLCIVYDAAGTVLVSTHPAAGRSSWVPAGFDPMGIDSLSCPSVSLCVTVDQAGRVMSSSHPARPGSWSISAALDDSSPTYECVHYQQPTICAQRSLSSVSCPTASRCLALDQAGNVVASNDPAGGATAWGILFKPCGFCSPTGGVTSLSCATQSFCTGVDGWGNFVSTDDLTNWYETGVNTGGQPVRSMPTLGFAGIVSQGVSCPSARLCVGTNGDNVVITTRNPTTPDPTWRLTGPRHHSLAATCVQNGWCFALDPQGDIFSSSNPAGGAAAWTKANLDPDLEQTSWPVTSFACPSPKLCITVDPAGNVLTAKRSDR